MVASDLDYSVEPDFLGCASVVLLLLVTQLYERWNLVKTDMTVLVLSSDNHTDVFRIG